jgi:hypothetical protein
MKDLNSNNLAKPTFEMPRDKNGLIIEPKDSETQTLIQEDGNRNRFASKVSYADQYVGIGRTFDEEGRYNCGRCNQARDNKCLWVNIKKIDQIAGSCKDWENICASDPEMPLNRVSPEQAVYGVAKNGVGFGCHRCPYSWKSNRGPDSLGRSLWCGYGGFRVYENSCCALNGAATLPDKSTSEAKESTATINNKELLNKPESNIINKNVLILDIPNRTY